MFIFRNTLSVIATATLTNFFNDITYLPREKSVLNQISKRYTTSFLYF